MRMAKQKAVSAVDMSTDLDGQKNPDASRLNAFVGYNLRRAAAKQRDRFRSVFEAYDIRPVQLTALTLLFDNMPLRQAALGKALEIKRANVVTLLDQLENRGLIMRQRTANDRRSHVLYLTQTGKALTTKLLSLHSKLEQDLANTLGETGLKKLVDLLRAFRSIESKPKIR